jgi:hypothetical protein
MSEESKSVPECKAEGGSVDGKPRPTRRREPLFATVFILVCLLLPTLAGLAGYRIAHWQMAQKGSWSSPGEVRMAIQLMQKRETIAGDFDSSGVSIDGVEK